jgi:hypothetical protein
MGNLMGAVMLVTHWMDRHQVWPLMAFTVTVTTTVTVTVTVSVPDEFLGCYTCHTQLHA